MNPSLARYNPSLLYGPAADQPDPDSGQPAPLDLSQLASDFAPPPAPAADPYAMAPTPSAAPPPASPVALPGGGAPPGGAPKPIAPATPPASTAPPEDANVSQLNQDLGAIKKPDKPKSNIFQTLAQAIIGASTLGPNVALAATHPKYAQQEAAYESQLADIAARQKLKEQAENTAGLTQQRQAKATDLTKQSDLHYGKVQVDPSYAPALIPDASGQVWVDSSVANTLSKPDPAKKFTVVPAGHSVIDEDGKVIYTAPAAPDKADKPTGDFEKVFLPAYAKGLNKTIDQLTPDETKKAFSEFTIAKEDPDTKAARLAAQNTQEMLRQMQLSQQPTPDQAKQVAGDIVAHRIAPEQVSSLFGGFGTAGQNFKRMVYTEAKKLDPNFDFEQASSDYGYGKSPNFQTTVRMMDSTQNSLQRIQNASYRLNNGEVRPWNRLVNVGKDQFNSTDLKRFQTDALLVGDEIGKVIQGGGTGSGVSDAKLKQAQDIFKTSDDPMVVKTAIDEVSNILNYRRKAVTRGTYMENVPAMGTAPAAPGAPASAGGAPAPRVRKYNPQTGQLE